jgi:predicted dehydrogenase
MLKVGVLGVGHLGKIHLKCIQMSEELELIGFYDPDDGNAKEAVETYEAKRFEVLDDLIQLVDIVDIVAPTTVHFELAKRALQLGKHVFIEKPVTNTIEEAEELLSLSKANGLKVQVGHVERFNPAFLALKGRNLEPMFIEARRLAPFNPRGTDVSVVLDLMIHDLDIVLNMVKSNVKTIQASGISIVSETFDICNVRIDFENGCVANLTASRMSLENKRKLSFIQKDAYISIDFLDKKTEIIRLFEKGADNLPENANFIELDTRDGGKLLHVDVPHVEPINAIKMELETFAESINSNKTPYVTLEDGYKALKLAHQILENGRERYEKMNLG